MILDLFRKHNEFYNIQGYDDIKDIVRRALDAEDNYNLLFIGPPASAAAANIPIRCILIYTVLHIRSLIAFMV
jgi:hypothetical protein